MTASDFSSYFIKFGEGLGPSNEQREQCNALIYALQITLQKHLPKKFRFDRICPAGSYEKKTAIKSNFDVDIVLYFNFDEENCGIEEFKRQKKEIVSFVEDIIDTKFRSDVEDVDSNDFGVSFKAGGFEFDVCIGRNLVKNKPPGTDVERAQFENAQLIIGNNKSQQQISNLLSSSLSESILYFVKKQSSFVHCLARICKFWRLVAIPETNKKVAGLSSTVELVALRSGIDEEKNAAAKQCRPNMLNAFKRFLLHWKFVERMDIKFLEFYSENDIPQQNRRLPVVLDPIDPFNNRMRKFKDQSDMLLFKHMADASIKRIDLADQTIPQSPIIIVGFISFVLSPWCCPKYVQLAVPTVADILLKDCGIREWATDFEMDRSVSKPTMSYVRGHRPTIERSFTLMLDLLVTEGNSGKTNNSAFHAADGMVSYLERKTGKPRGVCNSGYDNIPYDAIFKYPVGNGMVFIMKIVC